jgi:RNA polymerase sigma-70 factor (ECF subfamily)
MDGQADLADELAAVAKGDEVAFRRLWERASPVLFGLCLKVLQQRDAAEDALQDAFVRVWQKAGRYDRTLGDPLGWMAMIARNAALDRLRQRRREAGRAEPLGELDTRVWIDFDDVQPEVKDLLQRLDDKARTALLLAFWGGLTHTELAAALEVPLGTAKSWIRRALAELKDHLEP